MPDHDLGQLHCYLYDPEPNVRRLLRDALGQLRIGRIDVYGRLDALREAFGSGTPDLLVADAEDAASETLRLVHQLRHGQFAGNPFLGVIVTAFNPTKQLLSRVTNSGADALLVKPVSARQIQERVSALIDTPRRFVVTSDFIGPDRRRAPREGSQIPLLEVPNTMRLKATGIGGRVDIPRAIEAAYAEVNEQKLLRLAFQAAFLIEFARPGLAARPVGRLAVDHLLRVPAVLEDFVRRLPAPAGTAPAHPAAAAANRVVERIEQGRAELEAGDEPPFDEAGLAGLSALGLDVMAALTPGRGRDRMAEEVAAAVAAYRSRLEMLARMRAGEGEAAGS
jgi:CheY-like chemotaxis protein